MGRLNKHKRVENKRLLELVEDYKISKSQTVFDEIAIIMAIHISSVTKKFFHVAGHASDDIYQEALFALATKAIPDYDHEKGSFIGFSKLCIRRHIITLLKSANNNKHKTLNSSVSFEQSVNNDSDDTAPSSIGGWISDGKEDVVERIVRNENFHMMRYMLKTKLTGLEAQILDLYLKNFSYVDMVKVMNKKRRGKNRVDAKCIDNALCRIKKKAVELKNEKF
jgi:RNA polymerase sporulation-specific sigma factor